MPTRNSYILSIHKFLGISSPLFIPFVSVTVHKSGEGGDVVCITKTHSIFENQHMEKLRTMLALRCLSSPRRSSPADSVCPPGSPTEVSSQLSTYAGQTQSQKAGKALSSSY